MDVVSKCYSSLQRQSVWPSDPEAQNIPGPPGELVRCAAAWALGYPEP